MKVFVTGGTGAIGGHAVPALVGQGHTVTALYELVPVGAPPDVPPVDPSRYAIPTPTAPAPAAAPALDPAIARESMTVKLRYKEPDGTTGAAGTPGSPSGVQIMTGAGR